MATRCLSCMKEIEGAVCPYCGYPQVNPSKDHQLPVGTLLRERYRLGRVLGQGGFGITYLAWDELLKHAVAVKEFYPTGSVYRRIAESTQVYCVSQDVVPHYAYSRERFLREAQALVKFKEIPEVVDLLDFVKENNTAYIVMEFVRGVDLAKYIQRKGGKLSVEETFRILRPVMEALAKVHKGGIVHRDISPDNIILDPMGGAKLLDFGAVRAVENPDVEGELTKSTEAILKHGFAPMEQYNRRGSLGPWTDEYAMCATVWYCLTGRIPEEASLRMTEGIDPDWSTIPGLTRQQQKALAKGLSCRPKDRFADMDAFLEALFAEEEIPEHHKALPAQAVAEEKTAPEKKPEKKEAPSAKKEKAAGGKKTWLLLIPAAVVLLVAGWLIMSPGLNGIRYNKAEEMMGAGQFAEAAEIFDALGDYKDSAVNAEICRTETDYLQAEALFHEAQYTEAAAIYESLGSFRDSQEKLETCRRGVCYAQAEAYLAEGDYYHAATTFYAANGFRDAWERSVACWGHFQPETLSAGKYHTVGLRADGTVVATGENDSGQCDVLTWRDIVAVSAGNNHTVGLKADGTVVAVGRNSYGNCDVSNWRDIVAVSAGQDHTVGLKADGTVVAVGDESDGLCDVSEWRDIVAVSAGWIHTVGLKADGTVVATGWNIYDQCDVSDWRDIVEVSVSDRYTVGLKANGTVVAVGFGITSPSWRDIVQVDAGSHYILGLKADGTVVTDGAEASAYVYGWRDIVAVSAGDYHTVGLKADGTVVAIGWGLNNYGQCNVSDWTDIRVP